MSVWVGVALVTILGILLGSFLNVVVLRLPPWMRWQWKKNADDFMQEWEQNPLEAEPPGIVKKRSHCPKCSTQLAWYDNIPVISFLLLRGKCRYCQAPVSWQYPLIEIITGLVLGITAWVWWGQPLLPWMLGMVTLLTFASAIDWKSMWIPDTLVYGILWGGLAAIALQTTGMPTFANAIWGAIFGYGSLWTINAGFKLAFGKEGMGQGDFKLLAALGVWTGWQGLLPVVAIATVLGLMLALTQRAHTSGKSAPMPFGPSLAMAGWAWLIFLQVQ